MTESQIAGKARFDGIRYAQLWEDADVLVAGLGKRPGATLVSICSAGDNALAMLTLDPARVVVVDLSPAQIACLELRMAAFRTLDHPRFLELMGSVPSTRRGELLDMAARSLSGEAQACWRDQKDNVIAHGLGGIGKFERYFRILRRWLLPLVHGRRTIDDVFVSRSPEQRARFIAERWNNLRWRLVLKLFFSNAAMGRLGRDPAFFDHVDGKLSLHVQRRIDHAAIDLDPAANPYLHWILKGTHGAALPMPWRAEHFDIIRARLDRIEIRPGSLERFVSTGELADGFNLSDIFEYMDRPMFEAVYGSILSAARPGCRLVYWNMMVPRRVPDSFRAKVRRLQQIEDQGKAADKAFFYSDFVVEEVMP
jgi:S-adenosylmethionine-diacylglycerol 3-amino-3-carboxypropyl transferase